MCCHIEIEVADQNFHFTECSDTGQTCPSADPLTPDGWQCRHWSANSKVTGITRPGKTRRKQESNPGSPTLETDALTTRPTRRFAFRTRLSSCHQERFQTMDPCLQLAYWMSSVSSGLKSTQPKFFSSITMRCSANRPLTLLSEARHQGFSPGTPVSSRHSSVNGSANKISSNKYDLNAVKLNS